MDYAWRNTRTYFVAKNAQVLLAVVDYMLRERRFSWSGLHKVHNILGLRAKWLLENLKALISEGRIDIGGAMSSTPQPYLYEGEAFINNAIYGQKYFEKLFGSEAVSKAENEVLNMADSAGHHSQMPQITEKLGFKYYKFERPWEVLDCKKVPLEFYWEGLDGTRILCSRSIYSNFHRVGRCLGGHGSVHTNFTEAANNLKELLKNLSPYTKTGFVLLMDGSDWGLPSIGLISFIQWWNEREKVKLYVGTLSEYFRRLEKFKNIPVVKGCLDPVGWTAVFGRRSEVLHKITDATNNLLTAEKVASVSSIFGRRYPADVFEDLWTRLSILQFHDNLYQFDEDYKSEIRALNEISNEALRISRENLDWIGKRINLDGNYASSIIIFNPLAWRRDEIVYVDVTIKDSIERLLFIDDEGKVLPYQILRSEKSEDSFRVKVAIKVAVPPLGFRALRVIKKRPPEFETSLYFKNGILENRHYRIDLHDGRITSIYDKLNKKEIVSAGPYYANEVLCETGNVKLLTAKFDRIFRFRPQGIKVLERGPLRMRISVEGEVAGNNIIQYITIYDANPRIDFETLIECKVYDARFRAVFPINLKRWKIYCDVPFGVEERTLGSEPLVGMERSYGNEGSKGVMYALSWCEVTDGDYGVSIFNYGDNGYILNGNLMSLILHTSANPENLEHYRVCKLKEMSGLGLYRFRYALYPHVGDWRRGGVCRRSFEYRHPLLGIQASECKGDLPSTFSFFEISPSSLILTSFKRVGDEINVRFYETHGENVTALIKAGFESEDVKKTNFRGTVYRKVKNLSKIRVKPFEIINLRMRIRDSPIKFKR